MNRVQTLILRFLTLVLSGLFLNPVNAASFDTAEIFKRGNLAYEQGQYQQAMDAYRLLLTNGWKTGPVFFNLGNASFKAGRVGDAIYHYRKALEVNPRDADVKANLSFARDSISALDTPGIENIALKFFSLGELLGLTFFFFWALFLLLAVRVWRPDWKFRLNPWIKIAACMVAIGALSSMFAWQGTRAGRVAIAARSEVVARFGPLAESQTAYTVRDGTELLVADSKDQWIQVRDNRGRTAWVASRDIHLFP